jgi:hypothetical protein
VVVIAAGALAVALLVAALVARTAGDDDPVVVQAPTEPGPTQATEAIETEVPATPDPAATDEPEAGRPPAPADGEGEAPAGFPSGEAELTDPAGDLADPDGNPPPDPEPAADITAVALASDGGTLTARMQMAGPIGTDLYTVTWSLHLFDNAGRTYTVTVQPFGSEFFTGVLDWDSGEQTELPGDPEVDGDAIEFEVPAQLLPRVDGPFTWAASTQHDETYEDHAPDLRAQSPQPVPFPG